MAQISIQVNGRPYTVGCEDGQEDHLTELAALFDHSVRQVSEQVGQLGETRLFLMSALLLADELYDARQRLARVEGQLANDTDRREEVEERAIRALEAAAVRIEALAAN
jgi:cell division protein ZapA